MDNMDDTANQQTPPIPPTEKKNEPVTVEIKSKTLPTPMFRKEHMKDIFIAEFPKWGTITSTCNAIGLDRGTVLSWRKRDPEFDRKFIEADGHVTEFLEKTAMARAIKESDTLLIFLLKARNPEKYKDRIQHEIDPQVVETLITQFITVVKRHAVDYCPHCKSHLGLTNKIAKELESLSGRLASE